MRSLAPNIQLVAFPLLHVLDVGSVIIACVNVPAHIEAALVAEEAPDGDCILQQLVLHVHLPWLVAGEGHVKACQHATALIALQLLLVQEVLTSMPTAKEENSVSNYSCEYTLKYKYDIIPKVLLP